MHGIINILTPQICGTTSGELHQADIKFSCWFQSLGVSGCSQKHDGDNFENYLFNQVTGLRLLLTKNSASLCDIDFLKIFLIIFLMTSNLQRLTYI